MGAFKKYLASDIIEADDIPGYTIAEPEICQSCINFDTRQRYGDAEFCGIFNVDVHPYGSCPKWRERRG